MSKKRQKTTNKKTAQNTQKKIGHKAGSETDGFEDEVCKETAKTNP
ncbi:MAG: hypothetical protein ACLR5L_00815 [Clostridium sp.]